MAILGRFPGGASRFVYALLLEGAKTMDIRDEFLGVVDQLNAAQIDYAVCGGIALLFHGYPRLTTDIDLLVEDKDVERIHKAVAEIGFSVTTPQPIVFNAGRDAETRVRRVSKFEGEEHLILDLILMSSALEPVWRSRETLPLEGRSVSVLSRDGLIQMKRAAGRTQDRADIERLEGGSDEGA